MQRFLLLLTAFAVCVVSLVFLFLQRCDRDWCLVSASQRAAATHTYSDCVRRGFATTVDHSRICTLPSGQQFSENGKTLYQHASLPVVFSYPASWERTPGSWPVLDTLTARGTYVTLSLLVSDETEESIFAEALHAVPLTATASTIVQARIDGAHTARIALPWPVPKSGSGISLAMLPIGINTYFVIRANDEHVLRTMLDSLSFVPEQTRNPPFFHSLFAR